MLCGKSIKDSNSEWENQLLKRKSTLMADITNLEDFREIET